ncbi:unnamed protein product, partial [Prorocentrum cordatum]
LGTELLSPRRGDKEEEEEEEEEEEKEEKLCASPARSRARPVLARRGAAQRPRLRRRGETPRGRAGLAAVSGSPRRARAVSSGTLVPRGEPMSAPAPRRPGPVGLGLRGQPLLGVPLKLWEGPAYVRLPWPGLRQRRAPRRAADGAPATRSALLARRGGPVVVFPAVALFFKTIFEYSRGTKV